MLPTVIAINALALYVVPVPDVQKVHVPAA
jgi:hypothetical protein